MILLKNSWFDAPGIRTSKQRQKLAKKIIATENFLNYGKDYYDGKPGLGYAGYKCDGRFNKSVQEIVRKLKLDKNSKIVELGCAKGCILLEFYNEGIESLAGFDISKYAIDGAPTAIKSKLHNLPISRLYPIPNNSVDLVYSKDTFPHLTENELDASLAEINRIIKNKVSVCYLEIAVASKEEVAEKTLSWDPTHVILKPESWWLSKLTLIDCDVQVYFKELM